MKPRYHTSGFTLLELLVSVTLVVTVVGIVYGSVMTASQASQRTTQRLRHSQRGALALDHIACLWQGLYTPPNQDLPAEFRTALHDGDLLRFVSLSPWRNNGTCQPIWNRVTLSQGDLILSQSLLSPDLQDVLAEAAVQVLLEDVTQAQVTNVQNQPTVLRVTLSTTGSSGTAYEQTLVMTAPGTPGEVSP